MERNRTRIMPIPSVHVSVGV